MNFQVICQKKEYYNFKEIRKDTNLLTWKFDNILNKKYRLGWNFSIIKYKRGNRNS